MSSQREPVGPQGGRYVPPCATSVAPSFVLEDTILNEDDIQTLEGYEDNHNLNYGDYE
jgi:hypothetical protein